MPLTMSVAREARYRGLAKATEWTEGYVVLRELFAELDAERAAHAATQAEFEDLEKSFELRWKADQRAIKRWREAHPGKELVMPDQADLCVWLLEQMAATQAVARELAALLHAAVRLLDVAPLSYPYNDQSSDLRGKARVALAAGVLANDPADGAV